ncbi:MAG: Sir2 family NAD-dependent protein deacetylase [Acidimicrobiia bacterium]|nr:Sir2 family NAD-dependent protein deacetylase [Acidimicrobiia bacterium]MDH4306358.1 Sir2 family NAD-dependent protein deacetylase [Acidimicrobiia bacterium]MDH5294312.1 Sir2 family NAD-dependent protein deacetylase [Acidimicrobiia bacterium]
MSPGPSDPLAAAAAVLAGARSLLVFTGAGISTESGIPDFRGPDGLWTKVDPDDFTIQRYLRSREVRVSGWRMHQRGELWGARSATQPNRAHHAITEMWRAGIVGGCVTQNIDGLHQAAGLPDDVVAEVHGNVRKAHCLGCETTWPTEEVLEWVDAGDEDPHCPRCGSLVKTTTVMFGELLPDDQVARAARFAHEADAVLAIGTTLSVYPAADFALTPVRKGAPLVIVNMGDTDHDRLATVKVEMKAGDAMTSLAAALS